MARFVLLYHDLPPNHQRGPHWDLMFEHGESLRTWALDVLPGGWVATHQTTRKLASDCPTPADGNRVAARRLPDHRTEYLQYEGPVSGDRGRVFRVEQGTFELLDTSGRWLTRIEGTQLDGTISLHDESGSDRWWLTYLAS